MINDPKPIIEKIHYFKNEILDMEIRIRDYLSDRQRYSHPFPEDLIKEIRNYESQIYRVSNTEVQMHLEGLMNSLMVYERAWDKLFENDTEQY